MEPLLATEKEFKTILNDELRDSQHFELIDDTTGSSISGTSFVSHTGISTEITLVLHILITESDEGPAIIFFDDTLVVNEVKSNYCSDYSSKYLNYAYSKNGEINYLEIGKLHPTTYDKGEGELIISLFLSNYTKSLTDVTVTFTVGSVKTDDGSILNCLSKKEVLLPVFGEVL